jgi:hypothetical protein
MGKKTEKTKPVASFRAPCRGGVLEVSVWAHQVQTDQGFVTVHSCSINRSFTKEGAWGNTHKSFRGSDLLPLCHLLAKAYDWILANRE